MKVLYIPTAGIETDGARESLAICFHELFLMGIPVSYTHLVMGDYGLTVRPETIAAKPSANSQNPTEDIARLAGVRFANISEPRRGLDVYKRQM